MRQIAPIAIVAMIYCGCSSVTQVKELTESNAKALISEHFSKDPFRMPVGWLVRYLTRTRTDYKVPTSNEQDQIFKRLIEHRCVLQTVEVVSCPRISGTFSCETNGRVETWQLEPAEDNSATPNSATPLALPSSEYLQIKLTGQHTVQSAPHGITGEVDENGHVLLVNLPFAWDEWKGTYREEGAAAYLDFPGPDATGQRRDCSHFVGKAIGQRISSKMYTYAWSPEFHKQLQGGGPDATVLAGTLEVEEITDLRLNGVTDASARYTFKVILNDTGKLFIPGAPPAGTSQASFAKKPDGTWFLDNVGTPQVK